MYLGPDQACDQHGHWMYPSVTVRVLVLAAYIQYHLVRPRPFFELEDVNSRGE